MTTDPLDLVDPVRLVLLLLPERYRAPVGAVITLAVSLQLVAAGIVARLPLSARKHPRWGWAVRAAHWYSVLRLRDERGTMKAIGGEVAPRVTPAPMRADEQALPRPEAPAPIAPFDPSAHITREQLPSIDRQRGSVDLGGLVGCLVVAMVLGAALAGCPASRQLTQPALGVVDGCEPRATRCAPDGRPQVCSGSRRWTDADSVCATGPNVAAVCCLTRSPVTGADLHACVLAERCITEAR